jgi:hypothetical protein
VKYRTLAVPLERRMISPYLAAYLSIASYFSFSFPLSAYQAVTMCTPTIDIPAYTPPLPTKYTLDYSPLAIIDISTFDRSPEDRVLLARQLDDAVHNVGFWIVIGHGISDDEVNRQLAIGQAFFKSPLDDRCEYTSDFARGR